MFLIKYMLSCILLTVVVSSAKLNETPVDTQLEQQEILEKDSIKLPVKIEEATVNVDKIANTDNIKLEGKLSNIKTLNKEDKIILTEQPTTERAVVTEINVITEKSTEESTVSAKSLDAEKTTAETTIQTTIPTTTTTAAVTEKEIKTKKTTIVEVTTEQIISTTNAGTLI